jgi:hypothetical protein
MSNAVLIDQLFALSRGEHDDLSIAKDAADALAAQEWQTIDTAPRDGTAVWLWCDGFAYLGYCQPADPPLQDRDQWFLKAGFKRERRGGHEDIYGTYAYDAKPTLWRPLPPPPESAK